MINSKMLTIWLLIKGSRVRVPPGSPELSSRINGNSPDRRYLLAFSTLRRFFDRAFSLLVNSINFGPGSRPGFERTPKSCDHFTATDAGRGSEERE